MIKFSYSVPAAKKEATSVLEALFNDLYISKEAFSHYKGFLRQRNFFEKIKGRLQDSPGAILAKLQYLRKLIVNPK